MLSAVLEDEKSAMDPVAPESLNPAALKSLDPARFPTAPSKVSLSLRALTAM